MEPAEWDAACPSLTRLIENWRLGRIERNPSRQGACFWIDDDIRDKVFRAQVDQIRGVADLNSCSQDQYAHSLKMLLDCEEIYQAVMMRKQDQFGVKLFEAQFDFKFMLLEGYNELPLVSANDFVIVRDIEGKSHEVALQIEYIQRGSAYIRKQKFNNFWPKLMGLVDISIVPSGANFRWCHVPIKALRYNITMQMIVFEHEGIPANEVKIDVTKASTKELEARLNKLDERQRKAVVGILEARCRPKAYILTGAPGTGKTHTMIEAVVQIYERTRIEGPQTSDCLPRRDQPSCAKILVCSSSTFGANNLSLKIRRALPDAKVVYLDTGRYLAADREYDIVVTTIWRSGCMHGDSQQRFDYIFVDDASSCDASKSLVPLMILSPGGCLVLVGDLKQLKPGILCKQADELGLGTPLLERLSRFSMYQRDPNTKEHDSRFITCLEACHRCDSRIIASSNRRFYADKLRCLNETPSGLLEILRLTHPVQLLDMANIKSQLPRNEAVGNICAMLVQRLCSMGIEFGQIGVASFSGMEVKQIRSDINTMNRYTAHLKNRFAKSEFITKRLTWDQAGELSKLTSEGVDALKPHLDGSQLFKRIGRQKFVEYEINTFPKDPTILFERRLVGGYNGQCRVCTIDEFQGDEKDIMIISTVGMPANQLEPLNDWRRFNMIVNRAKWLVIVIGDSSVLEQTEYWSEFVADSKRDVERWPEQTHGGNPFRQEPLFRAV